jgi:CspA family cold shock protein
MQVGTIKKLVHDKGFGFIAQANGGDIFFHCSSVADEGFDNLQEGQKVQYDVDNNPGPKGKGPRAVQVTPA